jgi:ATP-dependent RNA helicase RhlE
LKTPKTSHTPRTEQTHSAHHPHPPHAAHPGPQHGGKPPARGVERSAGGGVDASPAGERVAFADLGLLPQLLRNVTAEGYTHPTPIQAQAIPHVLAGRDVLGCAQTGTGKTAAFSLPILHRLASAHQPHPNQHHHRPIRALILSPTRELSLQIEESLRTYGKGTGLRGVCIFGGVGQGNQTRALEAGVDVVVATPGRLIDLMQQGYVDLSQVQVFVLDEADRMLDMGFIQPIRQIASAIPRQRQTLLFSATMPKEIRHLAESLLQSPVSVQVAAVASTPDKIAQTVYMVPKPQKPNLLVHVLKNTHFDRVIVFTRTKHGADRVTRHLNFAGINAEAIHGDKRQSQRVKALANFRSGKSPVMVATDIAARGIDVDGISHVINFDIPNEPESYVHRIGRTARAGASGQAIAFCDPSGDERQFLRDVEKLVRKPVPVVALPELPPPPPRSERVGGSRFGEHNAEPTRSGYGHRAARPSRPAGPSEVRLPKPHPFEKHGFGKESGRPTQPKKAHQHQHGAPSADGARPGPKPQRPQAPGPRPFKGEVRFPKKSGGPAGAGAGAGKGRRPGGREQGRG